jgi:hypothetical protein
MTDRSRLAPAGAMQHGVHAPRPAFPLVISGPAALDRPVAGRRWPAGRRCRPTTTRSWRGAGPGEPTGGSPERLLLALHLPVVVKQVGLAGAVAALARVEHPRLVLEQYGHASLGWEPGWVRPRPGQPRQVGVQSQRNDPHPGRQPGPRAGAAAVADARQPNRQPGECPTRQRARKIPPALRSFEGCPSGGASLASRYRTANRREQPRRSPPARSIP